MTFDPTINIASLIMLVGFVCGAFSLWYNLRSQVQENAKNIKDIFETVALTNAKVSLAFERLDEARAKTAHELAEYKLQVAKEYATNSVIREVEERLVQAIERIGDRFDKYFDKVK